jgi:antitoxin component YwqK of YwqJK toxin-antitoxin module
MNKILIILSFVVLASCGLSQEEKTNIAAVTCSIMGETRNMDAAVRVREMNDAREKIGGEAFLGGDDAIQEAFEWGLCQELVLNETYYEILQPLKDAKRERQRIATEKRAEEQRIATEKQRIADSKPTVKEEFHSNGKLKSRANYQPKSGGGKKHGLHEGYFDNGQLNYKGNFKDGKKDGLVEIYLSNGKLSRKVNYKNGEYDGLYETYHWDGKVKEKILYKNGEYDGLYETYHGNGDLEKRILYKNGKHDGLYETYFQGGHLSYKSNWKDGQQYGRTLTYMNRGRKSIIYGETNYKDGKKDGLDAGYDIAGYVTYSYCYKNDEETDMSYCEK